MQIISTILPNYFDFSKLEEIVDLIAMAWQKRVTTKIIVCNFWRIEKKKTLKKLLFWSLLPPIKNSPSEQFIEKHWIRIG